MADALTGLPTHRDLLENLPNAGAVALWVDIDSLTWLNDQFGFEAGTAAVASVAKVLQNAVEPIEGRLFRVAGEEFLAVLPGFDRDVAVTLATKIVAAVSALQIPFRRLDKPIPKILHVNVAVLTLDPERVQLSIGPHGLGDPIHATAADAVYQEKLQRNLTAGVVAVV
jgi:diguanylate cyclase (GGDEF)-like protein